MAPDENQPIDPIVFPKMTVRAFARPYWECQPGDVVGVDVPVIAFRMVTEDHEEGEILICSCCLVKALRDLLADREVCSDHNAELLIALSQGGVDLRDRHGKGSD